MPKFRVRYVGEWDVVVEADGSIEAEMEAANQNEDRWIAEEIEEEEDNG